MIRKFVLISSMLILASGCGASAPAAKQADAKPANSTAEKKADATAGSTKSAATPAQQTVDKPKDDIWTYYNDAKWIDDFNGLKSEVEKVVVTDKGPKVQDGQIVDGQFVSYVGVKFKLTNTTKDKFTAYPDQARLVTSTGEQIEDPDMNGTDHIGGEIPDIYEPALNPLYRDVLKHYGVIALPCRIRHPNRKGKVESSIGHTQKTPLKGMRFDSLEEGQAYLDRILSHFLNIQ